jgi:hypothetical protein
MERQAIFDTTKKYQFLLSRTWDTSLPKICWILLNPSADSEQNDDETIFRCVDFSQQWGFGSMEIVYLFALRTTFIKDLLNREEPVGAETDDYIIQSAKRSKKIVLAWGGTGNFMNRNQVVLSKLNGLELHCLKLLIDGNPAHPLFSPKHQGPIPFEKKFVVDAKKSA